MSGRDFQPGPRSSTERLQHGVVHTEQSAYRAATVTAAMSYIWPQRVQRTGESISLRMSGSTVDAGIGSVCRARRLVGLPDAFCIGAIDSGVVRPRHPPRVMQWVDAWG